MLLKSEMWGDVMRGKLPFLFVLLAAVLWGTTGTAQALAPEHTNPIAFGAMRLAIGGTVLFILVMVKGSFKRGNWPLRKVAIAAVCMAIYQPFFFSAVKLTGIAVGTVVAIGSAPIIAGMLEWMFKRNKPIVNWWIATSLAIMGCVLLFSNVSTVEMQPEGIVMALGAGTSFAIYTLVSKDIVRMHPPEAVVAVVFTLSACMLLPLLFLFDLTWLYQMNGIATTLYIGVFATALAYLLFAKGLIKTTASTAVTLSLAEPLTAALLGVFLMGESLNLLSWLGVGFVFLAIVILTVSFKSSNKKSRLPI
jgi:DME family drug/metabolite transporter